jgi:hypothetical protein
MYMVKPKLVSRKTRKKNIRKHEYKQHGGSNGINTSLQGVVEAAEIALKAIEELAETQNTEHSKELEEQAEITLTELKKLAETQNTEDSKELEKQAEITLKAIKELAETQNTEDSKVLEEQALTAVRKVLEVTKRIAAEEVVAPTEVNAKLEEKSIIASVEGPVVGINITNGTTSVNPNPIKEKTEENTTQENTIQEKTKENTTQENIKEIKEEKKSQNPINFFAPVLLIVLIGFVSVN